MLLEYFLAKKWRPPRASEAPIFFLKFVAATTFSAFTSPTRRLGIHDSGEFTKLNSFFFTGLVSNLNIKKIFFFFFFFDFSSNRPIVYGNRLSGGSFRPRTRLFLLFFFGSLPSIKLNFQSSNAARSVSKWQNKMSLETRKKRPWKTW